MSLGANLKNTSSLFLFQLLFFFVNLTKSSFLSIPIYLSVCISIAGGGFFWGGTDSFSLQFLRTVTVERVRS